MSDPAIKTKPHAHQQSHYDAHRDAPWYGLLWEMGLGKSKLLADVASHLFLQRKIQGLLIVAPNSVYAEWVNELLPTHMAVPYVKLCFRTDEHGERRQLRRALFLNPSEYGDKLRVLCMSYDGVKSTNGSKLASDFVMLYKTMIVADESTALKNPETTTAKDMKKLRASCHFAWIATGTPIAQSPFDFHSQIEFLCPDFWKKHGMKSFAAFKSQFGIYELRRAGARAFNTLVAYRDLDRMYALIKPFCSRLTKEDSGVQLPPKTYRTISFRLAPEQRRVYDELRREFLTELDSGAVVEAPLAVVRLTRLQQIASGFVTIQRVVEQTPGLVRDTVESLEKPGDLVEALAAFGVSQEQYDNALVSGVERQLDLTASGQAALSQYSQEHPDFATTLDTKIDEFQAAWEREDGDRLETPQDDPEAYERIMQAGLRDTALGAQIREALRAQTREPGWTAGPVAPVAVVKEIRDVVPPDKNPRLKILVDLIGQASHKVIVWCRFVRDVEYAVAMIERSGVRCARYDGSVGTSDRLDALRRFKDPSDDTRVLVANVHSISQGVTLTIAKTMIYYSNSFSPEKRLQSEDRFHRIGQDQPVLIIDLVAQDTVDEKLIEGLRKKYYLSAAVMGDKYREWLQSTEGEEE